MAKIIKAVAASYMTEQVKENMSNLFELACLAGACAVLVTVLQFA